MLRELRRKNSANELLRSPVLSIRGVTEIASPKGTGLAREKSNER